VTRRSQHGYALVVVLVAIGVFALVVMALLDLVSTDTLTTSRARISAADRRAGDGALEVGIAQLKATPRARLLATDDPCAGLAVTAGGTPKRTVQIEGRSVDVDCVLPPDTRTTSLPSAGTGTVLTLLRDYDIAVDPTGEFLKNLIALLNGPTTVRYPGLIAVGDEPVRVWGDVKTRQWMLGSTVKAKGSPLTVAGSYAQGDFDGGACGGWDGASNLFAPPASFDVSATGGRSCGNASESARNAVTPVGGPSVPSVSAATSPATLPATCTDGSVVTLQPGAYAPAQVLQLNTWFREGSCDNATFWFQPGNYFFDATTDYSTKAALVFDDPSSEFVFGTPSGWAAPQRATAAFPEACDRAATGVTIVLGPTTSLQQVAGKVAMCGPLDDTVPVLSQQPAATLPDAAWAGEPATVTAAYNTVPNGQNVAATIAVPGGAPAGYPAAGKRYDGTEPTRQVSTFTCRTCGFGYRLDGLGDPTSPASDRKVNSVKVKVLGSSANVQAFALDGNVGSSRIVISVYRADGTTLMCQAVKDGWLPASYGVFEVELLPSCSGAIASAKDLETAKIDVSVIVNGTPCFCWGGVEFGVVYATVNLDYAWVETHTGSGPSPDPLPMNLSIDPVGSGPACARGNRAPCTGSFNAFGRVALPRTQIDVKWRGLASNPPSYEVPIFVGDVVARAMASSSLEGPTNYHTGPLAARLLVPASRSVVLRAVIDDRVVATAKVRVVDLDPTGTTLDPARQLDVLDWRYCNVPETPTATC